ncbi:MAG: energy-coupling factor transporter transmembrane component T [Anaerolineaceae bacterium]|nr:energy-coupling factor transporter transmembrane component T [Anaerolineaceae bacterium]
MIASLNFRFRNSPMDHIDPRTRWIFSMLLLFSLTMSWNWKMIFVLFCISLIWYCLSKLTWRDTRKGWVLVLSMLMLMIIINTLLIANNSRAITAAAGQPQLLWPQGFKVFSRLLHSDLSVERLWFALCQFFRVIGIAMPFVLIPYTMDPRSYGPTFSGLGLPDRLAYTIELAFRFVPTLGHNFQVTFDAQKARGFELENLKGGIFKKIARFAPLLIPVTMSSIVGSEDIANAMDLRGFGERKRTWLYALKFHWWDYAIIAFGMVMLAVSVYAALRTPLGKFQVPAFFYRLFR